MCINIILQSILCCMSLKYYTALHVLYLNFQLCDPLSLEDNGITNESNIEVQIEKARGLRGGADDEKSPQSAGMGSHFI